MGQQIAAMPIRWNGKGQPEVLMVTSRDTRRWVLPKGWRLYGKKAQKTAEIEALEEAGVTGYFAPDKIGDYRYPKRLADNVIMDCNVGVYPMVVTKLKRNWKEQHERTRRWFSAKKAAKLVDEPELAALLRILAKNHKKLPAIQMLRQAA